MARSAIEWTDSTWNPVTGCTKISTGCRHCYAEAMAKRLKAMGLPTYAEGFKPAIHPDVLDRPLSWRKPQMIFVNSMSDLFHKDVPDGFIFDIFSVMQRASWHTFQILTKRSGRLLRLSSRIIWPPNVWMGVTVETDKYISRIADLARTGAAVKFLSLEPLLGPLPDLYLDGVDWVVVGGESGPRARPMATEWVTDIQAMCQEHHVPFFFKQWGGFRKKAAGRLLNGRTWDELPAVSNF